MGKSLTLSAPRCAAGAGDCVSNQCNGSGSTVVAPDNNDIQDDGNQCTQDLCSGGVASHPAQPLGAPCAQNGGVRCDGQGACVTCNAASECPVPTTECAFAVCTNGGCGIGFAAAGTPVSQQASGDCKQNQCDGAGNIVAANDDGDLPVDNNPCTADLCGAGVPSNPPTVAGGSCGTDQYCDGTGMCVGCLSPQQCPGIDSECGARTCSAGTCGMTFVAAGTPSTSQTSGDCTRNQCDGAGQLVSAVDDTDVPNDANQCTLDTCTQGVPSFSNSPAGSACTQSGGDACDGSGSCAVSPTLTVLRIGDGSAALTSAGTAGFLDKRRLDGTSISTTPIPTTTVGSNRSLVFSGSATSDGALSRSADGHFVTFAGYGGSVGTASIAGTASNTTPRVIARFSATNTLDTSTALGNVYSANNIRAAASVDGTAFWAGGTPSGVVYATLGSTSGLAITSNVTNVRWTHVIGGQLFGSSGSGAFVNVFRVGTGAPTTAGQTATSLPGLPTSGGSPYGFVLFDRNPAVAGLDTLYMADDGTVASTGGVQKWSFDGSTWTLRSRVTAISGGAASGFRGLTGVVSGSNVTLFATTSLETAANRLVAYVDSAASNAAMSSTTGTTIATAATNTVLRGVAISAQ